MLDNKTQFVSKENLVTYTQALNTKQEAQNLILLNEVEAVKDANNQLAEEVETLQRTAILSEGGNQRLVGELTVVKDALKQTTGNLVVEGNLEVKGSTITKDTETVLVQDNFIIINSDGEELSTQLSGIGIKTSPDTAYGIVYDRENDSVALGKGVVANGDFAFNKDESNPILTRDQDNNIVDGHVLVWDAKKRIAVDGKFTQEALKDTFTTLDQHNELISRLEEESSQRLTSDQSLANLIDTVNTTANENIQNVSSAVETLDSDVSKLSEQVDIINTRVVNIESTDDLVKDIYTSTDEIKDLISNGTYSVDKLWGLSFRSVTDEQGNVNYIPEFIALDDGELG